MNDIRLRYRDTAPDNVWISPLWMTGNEIFLDIDEDFNVSLSKEIQKLTNINQITLETVVDTSIPATQKNLALLGISIDPNVIDNTYTDHDIDLEIGPASLPHDKLRIVEYSAEDNRIEVQILPSESHWIEKIKTLTLDQLDFGEFTFNEDDLVTNWTDDNLYNDGDPGYYFGHVFYGAYAKKQLGKIILTPADFRPLVHALKTMQLAFCEAGWKFSCPILETTTGRKIVTYVNSENFASTEDDLKRIKFKAITDGTFRFQHKGIGLDYLCTKLANSGGNWVKVKFNIEVEDPGGNYDPATGIFERAGIFDIYANLTIDYLINKASIFGAGSGIGFRLVHEYTDGTKIVLDEYDTGFTKDPLAEFGFELNFAGTGILVNPGEKIYVEYYNTGPKVAVLNIHNASNFYNEPRKRIIQTGDTIDIGANLRHDSCLDYLKGLCHLFQLMIYTDWSSNTVHFLTPFDVDFFGDSVSGYFNSSLNDLKPKMIERSEKYNQIEKVLKNRRYSFKKSTDAKIKSFEWNEYEPYSRFIDKGFDQKVSDQNEVFENPYFEPTFSADTGAEIRGGILEAPFMVDNLNGEISYNIAPRILLASGFENTFYETRTPSGAKSFKVSEYYLWNYGSATQVVPHCFQKCNVGTSITGTFPDYTLGIPDIKLTYGHHEDDLYEIIHKKYDLFIRNNPSFTFKVFWNPEDYHSEFFRERARISAKGAHDGDIMGRLTQINSFDAKTGIAELTMIPDTQVLDECIGFEVPLSCLNYPYIKVSKVGTVYTFSYGGDIASPINTVTWQYKQEGASGWTTGNVVTTPTKNTQVLMTMTFSNGCPPITLPYLIIVQLKPKVVLTKIGNKIEAEENGTHEITVSSTDIYWSKDGTNWHLYEDIIDISRDTNENYYFKAVVLYSSGEQRESDITVISREPTEGECPDPDQFQYPPTVIITKTPQSYFPYRTGEYNGAAVYDFIQYREKGKNQEWSNFDNEIISLQKCWEFRRSIIWCDKGCEPYCSPVVETDCGACVGTSTVSITPSSAVCTHEQKWENPDTPASLTWKVEPIANSIYHVPIIRTWIEQNAGAPVEIQERSIVWYKWNFRTEVIYTWNIGATINTIQVSEAVGLIVGTQHTLNVNVTYTSGDDNDTLKLAVQNAILSSLAELGFAQEQDFILYVNVSGGGTKTLTIGFVAKHNPTVTWLGMNNATDVLATSAGNVTASGKEFQLESNSAPILENYSPYGTSFKVRFRVSTVNYFLDDAASNFNEMVANASSPILTDTLSTGLTDTGKKFSLTGGITGCPGTTLWQWLYGGVKKPESGKVISRVSTAEVFIQSATEVILIATCQSTGYCTYEKRTMLTP